MKIKLLTLLSLLALLPVKAMSQDNSGWVNLFNGEDLQGWQVLNGRAEFKVEGGVIIGMSKLKTPNTFLATERNYGDFILEYEARMEDGLNSGVQIRSLSTSDYRDGRVHGYQVELDGSPRGWSGGIYDEARRGWLYNLECNPQAKKAYKHEEWNKFRVEVIGNNIRVWLNGVPAADIVDDMTASGFIALQVHSIGDDEDKAGRTVQFRNIKIKTDKLDEEKTAALNEIAQISYLTNQLTERERAEGWQLLWDGKTTDGWRGAKLDHFPEKGWKIEKGVLSVLKSGGGESAFGGDIVTTKKYGNFALEVDFKYTKGANSGIKYFVDTELNRVKAQPSDVNIRFSMMNTIRMQKWGQLETEPWLRFMI